MADAPLTLSVLARFDREVILPDIERVVEGAEHRLRNEVHALFDSLAQRLGRLSQIRVIEERLER